MVKSYILITLKEKKMKDKKTLGWTLFILGSILGLFTLLLAPIAMYGLYLLLGVYKPAMGKAIKIVLAIIGGIVVPLILATIYSFMLY